MSEESKFDPAVEIAISNLSAVVKDLNRRLDRPTYRVMLAIHESPGEDISKDLNKASHLCEEGEEAREVDGIIRCVPKKSESSKWTV